MRVRARLALFAVVVAAAGLAVRARAVDTAAPSALPTEASAPAAPRAAAAPPLVGPHTYALDAAASDIVLRVDKDGVASALAHDHAIASRDAAGEIEADVANPRAARVSISVPMASLVVDDAEVRRAHGLADAVSARDRASIDDSMKGADVLNAHRFPTARFVSTAVETTKQGVVLRGSFTLHGVTKPMRLPVDVTFDGPVVTARARVRFKTSDYGIAPYSAFLGAIKVKDEVELHLNLVARAAH